MPEEILPAVRNNGCGLSKHSMFWRIMASPNSGRGGSPAGELGSAIDDSFGSFDGFKKSWAAAVAPGALFGSG